MSPDFVKKYTRFASKNRAKKRARSFESDFFMLFCTHVYTILYSKKSAKAKIGKIKKSRKT
jgi:hypothetical protein